MRLNKELIMKESDALICEKEDKHLVYDPNLNILRSRNSNDLPFNKKKAKILLRFRTEKDPEYKPYYQRLYEQILENTNNCGRWVSFDFYCKKCESEGHDFTHSFLKRVKYKQHCGIRYCDDPECVIKRYALILEGCRNIKRIKNLNSLWHFVIGFEKIDIKDFESKRKEFEKLLHVFFNKCRSAGLNIQALKFLDISKGDRRKEWDGKYYIHYHLMGLPPKDLRKALTIMHSVKFNLIKNQKKKLLFNIKSFGYKKKSAMLSYMALRVSGLYKTYDAQIEENFEVEDLITQIRNGKFMFLKDLFDLKEYMFSFHNKRFLSAIGNIRGLLNEQKILLQCSNTRNILSEIMPKKCRFHGYLEPKDVRMCIELGEPPDELVKSEPETEVLPICEGVLYRTKQKRGELE